MHKLSMVGRCLSACALALALLAPISAVPARADDQIGLADGLRKTLARAGPNLLDAKQEHHAQADGKHRQARGQPAIE